MFVLKAYQMKIKFVISKFQRQNQLKKKWKIEAGTIWGDDVK